jgi:phosphomannomutase
LLAKIIIYYKIKLLSLIFFMSIIKSISGIRGTIGGKIGDNLTPIDVLKFSCAYAEFIKNKNKNKKSTIVIGRDSRISGEQVKSIVVGSLLSIGLDVIDLGMAATPTVAMATISQNAQGGVIISASHNPGGWNALKLLNSAGEFLSRDDGLRVLEIADDYDFNFVNESEQGKYFFNPYLEWDHINRISKLPLIEREEIKKKDFKVIVDGINSIGAKAIEHTLEMLGIKRKIIINDSMDGNFSHNPEPLEKNLGEIMNLVKQEKADLGIVVDPDVDRLALIDENGDMFGEEYTLVAISDYVLNNFNEIERSYPGVYRMGAVSNLSSSRALNDVVKKYQGTYIASAVGEVNVVEKIKENKFIIGGEGNGGVIYSPLHYGRDALVGVALFLSCLATSNKKVSEIRKALPDYFMVKDKFELDEKINISDILEMLKKEYQKEKIIDIDGVKINFTDSWVHLRASNTEPILRIYAEARNKKDSLLLVNEVKDKILAYIK